MLQLDNTFSEQLKVPSFMVDKALHLTPTFLFNLMQEIAVNHVATLGIGWNFLHPKGLFWALSKLDIEWLQYPQWGESIRIITWGKQHQYLIQPRDFIVENEAGEPLIKATSHWVILNLEGKPQMLNEYESYLQNQSNLHAIERQATRIRALHEPLADLSFKPVVYTDIDMNGHANNSAYVTWIMNNFSNDFHQQHELTFLAINYLVQTHPDDKYAIVQQQVAPNDFISSIVTEKDKTEVCRVETRWKLL